MAAWCEPLAPWQDRMRRSASAWPPTRERRRARPARRRVRTGRRLRDRRCTRRQDGPAGRRPTRRGESHACSRSCGRRRGRSSRERSMSASSMQACAAPDSASSQSTPRGRLAKPSAYAASNASRARSSSPRSACSHANVKRYARHAGPLWERSATVPPAGGADERIPLGKQPEWLGRDPGGGRTETVAREDRTWRVDTGPEHRHRSGGQRGADGPRNGARLA